MDTLTTPRTYDAAKAVAPALLAWYDRHRRRLPWRAEPGETPNPYHVWLSEVMLQQTTVPAVIPYFRKFTEKWPNIEALSRAPLDDVLAAWAGLGYYARARNLHKCAGEIAAQGGMFPQDEAALKALPGVGDYMAAAIASISFDRPANVVDGNVERVVARFFAIESPLPGVKAEIRARAAELAPRKRPGDYAQAMMDLGSGVCTPRSPKCLLCPLAGMCRAHALGVAETLPRKEKKKPKPTRHAVAFWLQSRDGGHVLMRRRPETGLLGGMLELPSTPWAEGTPWSDAEARAHLPAGAERLNWRKAEGQALHTFTHFHLIAEVWCAETDADLSALGIAQPVNALGDAAIPTVIAKMIRLARQS